MSLRSLTSSFAVALFVAACSKGDATPAAGGAAAPAADAAAELTPWQLEHGIGPITQNVELKAVDPKMAHEGQELFQQRCASCHKPDVRYVGPALGGVVGRRAPEYVMNMILDPASMTHKHPEAKKLVATFLMEMPNQGLNPDQARLVLEYLRTLPAPPAQ